LVEYVRFLTTHLWRGYKNKKKVRNTLIGIVSDEVLASVHANACRHTMPDLAAISKESKMYQGSLRWASKLTPA
jgi:hypothetical protein